MLKILITGAKGQLGLALVRQSGLHEIIAADRGELDITDEAAVLSFVDRTRPDVIINAAAYTAVDQAESDMEAAFAVNRDGSIYLARACSRIDIPLIHVSTDYVFDGGKQGAYVEDDSVAPLGVYGASKLAGERAVLACCPHAIVLRTSWVFSSHGNNFVKTMLRLGSDREELNIVADQHGCPTSAAELARAIYAVLDVGLDDNSWGVYHFCQPVPTTWFEFAKSIFEIASDQGELLKVKSVNAITTEDYSTPAKRPMNSVMNCSHFCQVFNFEIKPWSESLQDVIKELKDE